MTAADAGAGPKKDIRFAPRSPRATNGSGNGSGPQADVNSTAATASTVDAELAAKIGEARTRVQETFGKVAMAMMAAPQYRHCTVADLGHLVFDPLVKDRVAIAQTVAPHAIDAGSLVGIAIWASVSSEVDTKIREQIKAGVYPVRLLPDDWASGEINWLLDVIAPNQQMVSSVVNNFKQVVKEGQLYLHPRVAALLERGEQKDNSSS